MGTKAVVDIDVRDQKFDRFNEHFKAYQEALAKTPGMWKDATKESEQLTSQFERMAAALLAQSHVNKEIDSEEKERLKRLTTSETLWTSIGKSSATLAKNVADVSLGIIKWGSLLAGGSLFGLDRLGSGAANDRRSSTGLGLSVGEQKAFNTDFSRFVDTSTFLHGINESVSDVSKQGPLWGLGVNPNQSTSQVALATMDKLRALLKATPENLIGTTLSSRHLDSYLDLESAKRLRNSSSAEYQQQRSRFGPDVKNLGFDDKTGKAWQDFTTQMERAEAEISKVFVKGLVPLAAPLEHLSDAVVKTLQRFMNGGAVEQGIDTLAKWIEKFDAKVTSDKFQSAVDSLVSDTSVIASGFHVIANLLRGIGYGVGGTVSTAATLASGYANAGWRSDFLKNPSNEKYLSLLADTDKQFGLPAGFLEKQWRTESGGSLNPANSSKGAIGAFQFMPGTAKELGIDPHDPLQSAYGAGQYDAQLMKKYHGDLAATLSAYNYGEGNTDRLRAQHPRDWQNFLPKETQGYLAKQLHAQAPGVTININNNTGGDAVVSASQLSQ